MTLPANDPIRIVAELSDWITGNDKYRVLARFDPYEHVSRRWGAVARALMQLSATIEQDFVRCAGGVSPFREASEYLSRFTSLPSLASVRPAVDIDDAIAIYEEFLHEDFPMSNAESPSVTRAVARRNAGAFYTPRTLADRCVRVACEVFVERKLGIKNFLESTTIGADLRETIVSCLSTARVLDPTCGAGQFLERYLAFVGELSLEWFGRHDATDYVVATCNNLWGVDVDPLALSLARITLLNTARSLVGQDFDASALSEHLCLGNTLVRHELGDESAPEIEAAVRGDIYATALCRPVSIDDLRFDIILGNPPWEKLRLEERDFFSHLHADLDVGATKSERERGIATIRANYPLIYEFYEERLRSLDTAKARILRDPWFEHSSHGELNTSNLFTELASKLLRDKSSVTALLVKTSTVTHYANRALFLHLQTRRLLNSVFDFTNRNKLFPIDSRERFSLLVLSGESPYLRLALNLVDPDELFDRSKQVNLSSDDLWRLNPSTGMIPTPRSPLALSLLQLVYKSNDVFSSIYPTARFGRLVHLTMHSKSIRRTGGDGVVGVQEGKFIERYDGRFSTFNGVPIEKRYTGRASSRKLTHEERENPLTSPESRYYIDTQAWDRLTKNYQERWSLFWRSTTSSTNARTCIATILPHGPAIQSLQMVQLPGLAEEELAILLAVFNSTPFDFIVRSKLAGIDLTQAVIGQTALPPRSRWQEHHIVDGSSRSLGWHVASRVGALLSDDERLRPFVATLSGVKEHKNKARKTIENELDDLVFVAYGLDNESRRQIYLLHDSRDISDV
jgi:hypothetical protein